MTGFQGRESARIRDAPSRCGWSSPPPIGRPMLPTTPGRYVAGEVQGPMNGVYDGDVFELAADWRKVVAFDGTPIFASIEYTTALTLSRAHLEAL